MRTLLETSGLPPEQQSRVQLQVASGLSRDPAALRDYLKTLPDKGLKVQAYAIGTLPAVRMKMDDLYSLACELERTRPSFYGHTMFDWTGTDPANLLLEAAKLPDTDSRGVIVDSLSQALLLNGNGLTAAQAANLPESVRGQSLKYLAALEIAKNNRAGAMELIDLITPVNYEGKRMQSRTG